jgi:iron complex outermembrane receptor protein
MSIHSRLLGGVSLLATALITLQGATAQDQQMETVVVTGIRAAIVQGLELKRESNVIVESIAAEDIGKMPDANLAEALQRVPGVAIDRDGGEGRYVSIRGLGPDFNTVLLNGRRIATSEWTRSFAFDTLSSDMVGGMNVYKTQQSFIREGGVGGTVDVRTVRPMDHMGFHAAGRLELNHEDNNGKTVPQGSVLLSDTFLGDSLGVLINGSYQERRNRIFNVSTDHILTSGIFSAAVPDRTTIPAAIRGLWLGDVARQLLVGLLRFRSGAALLT